MVSTVSEFHQLLDATIGHLEALQGRGVRSVNVSPETLQLFLPSVRRPATTATAALERPISSQNPVTRPSSAATEPNPFDATITPPPPIPAPKTVVSRSASATARWNLAAQQAMPSSPATPPTLPPPLPGPARVAAFEALSKKILSCVQCSHLASSRKSVVVGTGNLQAQIMFVGEAPGADEDEQGLPFVGRSGELLTRIIQAMGLNRSDVFIGNILKCRPDTPGQTSGNRKPTPMEISTCIPFLHEQIHLIQPQVMVALGVSAMEGLLGKPGVNISSQRGTWTQYRGIPLMPTYHPAYLIRNQSLAEKRKVWEDMMKVMEKTGLPISDKQRAFFLAK